MRRASFLHLYPVKHRVSKSVAERVERIVQPFLLRGERFTSLNDVVRFAGESLEQPSFFRIFAHLLHAVRAEYFGEFKEKGSLNGEQNHIINESP